MTIRVKLLAPGEPLENPSLRKRRAASVVTATTRHYLFLRRGVEVALVAIDRVVGDDTLVLDEIFVDPEHRSLGIGTEAMKLVELLAREEGCARIRLCPQPIEEGAGVAPASSREALEAWYARLGYTRVPGTSDEVEKLL
jgi:GNAT superfamily N-acetyltransferase